ncbi:molybdate ABC transporter substrate-binding protein [Aliiroseovarius sp. KMU-50]|uniref:Molybdate ABC transporter substrate-binding protein n=1 Tax=Aliiroseovarius salicola TaxID=3009082 RepID=A0ABT4W4B0_9RHOB|nr:molybdate ABC transporter substrate-binding protein [Aliiroseovarius sp. KMU-50]MDA5095363.1 molybdate ABC transporter substrate-binding protein [Aliiroseovarius sp. KMU-50]
MFLRLFNALAGAALSLMFALPVMAGQVTIFAAASLKTALEDMVPQISQATGHEVTLSFAGSSALARQIEYGAPADLYISANPGWMDHLSSKGLIQADTRVDLVANRLALVGREGEVDPVNSLTSDFDIKTRLGEGRLSMALVEAVPAGIYGKAALQSFGWWDDLFPMVAQADNVRAALALVAQGAAPLGIVYESDAMADPRVSVIGVFPPDSHPPIRYPAALTHRAAEGSEDVLDWLRSSEAQALFVAHGFRGVDP